MAPFRTSDVPTAAAAAAALLYRVLDQDRVAISIRDRAGDARTQAIDVRGDMTCAELRDEVRIADAAELIEDETLARWSSFLPRIVEQMTARPSARLDELTLLDEEEVARQLRRLDATATPLPEGATVHGLFIAQAARDPERIAAVCDRETLTYAQLDARSSAIARAIAATGARKQVVAIMLERSCDLLAATLGVLRSGNAFVMLDPAHPRERLEVMLQESGAVAVAGRGSAAIAAPLWVDLEAVPPATAPAVDLGPDDIAYVIFTSGSTGRPKAVAVPHRAMVNRMQWLRRNYDLGADDVSLQKTSLSFDPSICEMFRLLPLGGRVCFLRHGAEKDPEAIVEAVERHGVTVIDLVPSPLIAVLEHVHARGTARRLATLRWVYAGAETLPMWLAELFDTTLHQPFGTRLINTWGATETSVDAIWFDVTGGPRSEPVPIGAPIDNCGVLILSRSGSLLPDGAFGELYVTGACVAAGYANDSALTASRFVELPVAPGRRFYRSGDLARFDEHGQLEFGGRVDDQLKVRGVRIEPGEIAQALLAHPAVAQVLVRGVGAEGASLLVAYVRAQEKVSAEELRAFVAAKLPEGYVPDHIYVMERFPLTTSEKIDVASLPTPFDRSRAAAPMGDAIEDALAAMAAEVLGGIVLGPDDHFFRAGGHSLAALRLCARVFEHLGANLTARDVFRHPTLRALAAHIRASAPRGTFEGIPRVAEATDYALSHAQQRLWVLSQFENASAAYNIPFAVHVQTVLDRDALQRALDEVTARHEILRTTFTTRDGVPVQQVHAPRPGLIRLQSWDVRTADALQHAHTILREEHERRFDLASGPPWRAGRIVLDGTSSIFFLTIHHIIADAWSLSVLVHELFATCAGRPAPSPLPLQYKDYAAWQNAWIAGPEGERARAFWRSELADPPPPAVLPPDRPRPAAKTFSGRTFAFDVPAEVTAAWKQLGREHDASLFMSLLALLNVHLHRRTGQRDLVVGTPVAGRPRRDLEMQLGCFVNSIALRTKCDPAQTFAQFLGEVRDACLRAFEHQEYPFDLVVRDLGATRDAGRSPLFDMMLVLQNAPAIELGSLIDGVGIAPAHVDLGLGKLDLILTFTDAGETLQAEIQYDTDLYADETIERTANELVALMTALAADAQQQLRPRTTAASTLHELVARQVAESPHRVAVTCEGRQLTYAELDAAADGLAVRLRDQCDVRRGDLVAFCLERSEQVIVTELAIAKAGAAFLPIDSSYPEDRVRFILEDSAPKVVIVDRERFDCAPVPVLRLDRTAGVRPDDARASLSRVDDLAYVIYTSGSTGRPKGVLVEHAQIASLLTVDDWLFDFRADDVWTLYHSVSFDFSVWEAYVPLTRGARVIVVPSRCAKDPAALVDLLIAERVTVFCAVPSLFGAIAQEIVSRGRGCALALRYVIFGGEPVNIRLAPLHALHPGIRFINGYGITETTIFSTFHELGRDDGSVQNIGRPISNQFIRLLDERLEEVGDGEAGEICIGGAAVSRGYLNRPDLTAARFIDGADERLYRSGDLARRTRSGELLFLGRRDSQVKVRGFRIELEEIRRALFDVAQVAACEVLVREREAGVQELVAYVQSPSPLDEQALRRDLARVVPDYMVPSRIVVLETLPVSANGKIDTSALAALETRTETTPPQPEAITPLERDLLAIWREVLDRDALGVTDDFFDQGGHSLTAVQLVSRVREQLGAPIGVSHVFTHTTVRAMAAILQPQQATDNVIVIPPAPSRPHYALAPAQREFWVLEHFAVPGRANHTPLFVENAGELARDACEAALDDVFRHFEILRTTFANVDGEPRAFVGEGRAAEAFRWTDASDAGDAAAELERIREEESRTTFDLARGPLVRMHLVRVAPRSCAIVFTAHHIIWDGWSFDVFLHAWRTGYDARVAGRTPTFEPPRVQFLDFAEWHAEWLRSPDAEPDLEFWTRALHALGPLPFEESSSPQRWSFYGRVRRIVLDRSLTEALRTICRKSSATLFIGLQALVKIFLHTSTGRTDITVGSPTANRLTPELELQPGPFLNVLVLRDSVQGHDSLESVLLRVRTTAREAYARPLIPPEAIAMRLHRAAPLFDVGLTLQSQAESPDSVPVMPRGDRGAFFGLTTALWFDVVEHDDGLVIELGWSEERFYEAEVDAMAELFLRIASAAILRPRASVSSFSFAGPALAFRPVAIDLDI